MDAPAGASKSALMSPLAMDREQVAGLDTLNDFDDVVGPTFLIMGIDGGVVGGEAARSTHCWLLGVGSFYNSAFGRFPLTIVIGCRARVNPVGTEFALYQACCPRWATFF